MKNILISILVLLVSWMGNTIPAQSSAVLTDSVKSLYAQGKYAEALPYAQEALRLGKIEYGENSTDFAGFINDLATLYMCIGEYRKADTLFHSALKIDSVTIGIDHFDFATRLNNLAGLNQYMGDHKKAESLYLDALKIFESKSGEDHSYYSNTLKNLVALYKRAGDYQKAEPLLFAILKTDSLAFGTEHPSHAIDLNNLANNCKDMGKYQKAERLYLSALKRGSLTIGADQPGYAIFLNDLAMLYQSMGEYGKAEPLLQAAIKIDSATFGTDLPAFATHLNNLAVLYQNMGDFRKVESLFLAALRIDSVAFGINHPTFANTLNNLASHYQVMGKLRMAESLFLTVLRIDSITPKTDFHTHSWHLSNLAMLYEEMGEYQKAKHLIENALKIDSTILGAGHPSVAILLNNLGAICESKGEYHKAEKLFLAALKIDSSSIGTNHPDFASHLRNLAYFRMKAGKQSKMKGPALFAFEIARENSIQWLKVLSGNQRIAYWHKHNNIYSKNHTFIFAEQHIQAELAAIGYESSLLEKGILLRSDQAFRNISSKIRSDTIREKLENLRSLNRRILKTGESNKRELLKHLATLQNQAEALQKELVREVPEYGEYINDFKVTWPEIQANLDETSVAIEFVHFPFFDGEKESGYWYGAYILKKGDTLPQVVGLCPADTLQKALGSERESHDVEAYVESLYGFRGVTPGRKESKMTRQLYELIWKPLDSLLQGVRQVYYAPAGILHNVAFAALPIADSTVLSDKYRLVQMGTTGTLAKGRKDLHAPSIKNAVVFGGMGYDLDGDSIRNCEQAMGLNRGGENGKAIRLESGLQVYPWQMLPGTKTECDSVVLEFNAFGIPAVGYSGPAASEGVFGSLEGEWGPEYTRKTSPTLIHVATHGFSIPVRPRPVDFSGFGNRVERFHWSEDPLRRAGLIFSGANNVWTGNAPTEGLDDGILTSAEIAVMDLSDTRLVVLSACQTGLGDIVGNEGVFGLQRAFKLAGVELVIASLWRVPDKETAEFMGLFYGDFVAGMEVREAFRGAQEVMMERYRGEPFKWAAFVLME